MLSYEEFGAIYGMGQNGHKIIAKLIPNHKPQP